MNIPDSISMSDLLSIQQDAEKDPGTDKESLRGTDLYDLAAKLIKQATSKTDRPAVLHKAMAFVVINHMIEWHTKQADAMREEGLDQSATSWMRDAGKFQAIAEILASISVDDDDFMLSDHVQ